ncbi:MAG: hypothetical protein ACD_56C00045G0001 [uncultured bacterium]|nr:MAG: hypothetical protein ACD_56C00045G0001 [uncultured bacterium]
METSTKKFKVAVLGGGITGTSIFYTLSKYTDIGSIALIEKCSKLGQINSRENNNSQTLHFGDIEANYSPEKARSTKESSAMVVRYLNSLGANGKGIYKKSHQMLLAVGNEEIETFEERFVNFKKLFPDFRKIGRQEIASIEPEIVRGRKIDEKIIAGLSENGYVVDFGALSKSFVQEAVRANEQAEVFLSTKVIDIKKISGGYEISTDKETFQAETVIVAMCSHSLLFAKSLGYGNEFSILPVGGNFYTSNRKMLNGKVYTMQSGKLPFAGVHGDPNIHSENETRFGPTANILPLLERNNFATIKDFFRSSMADARSSISFFKVISEKTLFIFLAKSLIYELPYFGPRAYAKLCQKIIPTISCKDFRNGKSEAGIRPQLIDNATGKLRMGEVEIVGDKIIFNISPSPGASVCLKNAKKNVLKVMEFFNGKYSFSKTLFDQDLKNR